MGKGKPYHHGDLREALVQAGLELLRERGLEGVRLRETASRAGVSHTAPYHHFPNKAMLIEALAVESFGRFTRALQRAWEETPGPSIARFRALGLAYVRFALEHSAEFRLMNRPELRRTGSQPDRAEQAAPVEQVSSIGGASPDGQAPPIESASPVEQAAQLSYGVLLDGIRASQREGFIAEGDPEPLALAAWSTVHGLSVLLIDGLLEEGAGSPAAGLALAEVVTETLGQGLIVR